MRDCDGGLLRFSLLGREIITLGHVCKLIPPIYVKPFLKRQKNDANDSEAIVEAAQRQTRDVRGAGARSSHAPPSGAARGRALRRASRQPCPSRSGRAPPPGADRRKARTRWRRPRATAFRIRGTPPLRGARRPEAAGEQVGEKGAVGIAGKRHGRVHRAVSFVPIAGNGGDVLPRTPVRRPAHGPPFLSAA